MLCKDTLILITAMFPFGSGETFLESEVEISQHHFKKIIILAKNVKNDDCRAVPPNCEVHILCKPKLKLLDKASCVLSFSKEIFKQLFQDDGIKRAKVLIHQTILGRAYAEQVGSFIEDNSSTVLYSYWLDETAIALAMLKEKDGQLKVVSRAHAWDVYFERHQPMYLPLRPYLSMKLDEIHFVSKNGLECFKKLKGVEGSGLVLSRLGTIQEKTVDFELQDDDCLKIVSCSSIIALKRVNLMIDTFSLLKTPFVWYHIGDGNLREEMEKYAEKKLNLGTYHFIGQLENQKVLEFYLGEKPDFLINLSETEGLPVSMMEAMSCGVPCIGTNVGGVSEIIENKENGYLLEPNPRANNVAGIIENYEKLSLNEKRLMRKKAFKTWASKFNALDNYGQFAEMLNSVK